MYPATESGQTESGPFVIDDRLFSMTVFIRRATVQDNTTSECVPTVAVTYGCKILQLYEYDANVYGYYVNCE